MVNELANHQVELLEKVIIEGDLEKLSAAERMEYYEKVCDSLGLNPLTRPFDYIKLSGKLTLYAKKDATEQLAKMHHVSIKLQPGRSIEGVYLVQATASTEYRSVDATGAVPIESLKGEAKANALMKAETKACRRAVLRLVGLGWLDETEVAAVPGAVPVMVDPATGEIVPPADEMNENAQSSGTVRQSKGRPRKKSAAEEVAEHFCGEHEVGRNKDSKGRWYHKYGDNYCIEGAGLLNADGEPVEEREDFTEDVEDVVEGQATFIEGEDDHNPMEAR